MTVEQPFLRRRRRRPRPGFGSAATGVLALAALAGVGVALATRPDRNRRPDDAPFRSRRRAARRGGQVVVGRAVTVNKPRAELYAFWRDFQNLPRFAEGVERVTATGPATSRWTLSGPGGRTLDVEVRVTEARDGELIAFASAPGAPVEMSGRVTFKDAPPGRGTIVDEEIAYRPPGGELGRLALKLTQTEPRIRARRDLKRLKMLMETGEIATSQLRNA